MENRVTDDSGKAYLKIVRGRTSATDEETLPEAAIFLISLRTPSSRNRLSKRTRNCAKTVARTGDDWR